MSSVLPTTRVNELIRLFGDHQLSEMRAMKRSTMQSMLFDLPRRSPLGWQCLYEHEADFLREACEHASPEEIGRRMRTVGSRPYALQPFIIMCSYLGARQQRMLDLGLHPGDPFAEERPEDLTFVVDFWARLQGAYRSDDALLPGETGGTLPILDEDVVEDLADRATPADPDRHTGMRRMAATLELYEFILHGEQRDGIFGHGPYDLGAGRLLFCKEFNDLRNDYMPWARTEARCAVDNVVVVQVAHDVELSCDMFGSMTVEPHELGDRLEGIAVVTNEGGTLRELADDERAAIQRAAADGQEELFLKAVEWDDRYKIEYGAPMFANHLKPIFDLVGMPEDAGRRLMEACQGTADAHVDELLSGNDVPSIWKHMADPEGPFYWPLVD